MSNEKELYRHDEPHGLGDVYFIWQTGGSAQLLASTGSDGTVAIFSRQGQILERIVLQGLCTGFGWDSDGDLLAIITSSSSQVILWDAHTQKKQIVDTGLRDALSCVVWAKSSPLMAVATTRGNLAIYDHQTTRRIPILGKHSKRITCGSWSSENILALGSDDKTLSLSTDDGNSLRVVQLRDVPSDMFFAEMKTDERVPGENTVSMILGKRTLYLYHLPEPDSPTELGFQHRYGSLNQHKWFGDGYILLGFSLGHVVAISTHPREVGQELWQVKNHKDSLSAIAMSKELQLVGSCGDNNVKIHPMANLQETSRIINLPDQTGVKNMEWSSDGQLLAVSTNQGAICVFVTQLHSLFAISPPRICLLSSLAEVSIYHYDAEKLKSNPTIVKLEIEPSFIGIGPFHLACGMNNHIWFYDLGKQKTDTAFLLGDREYMAEVNNVKINEDFCAVQCGGHIMLHTIEVQNPIAKTKQPQLFPDEINGMQEACVTSLSLTVDFLIFSTDLGDIVYFSLEKWSLVLKYRHKMGVKNIYSDADGARLIFVDDHNDAYVYTPANEETVLIPSFPKNYKGVLWDYGHPQVFVGFDDKICTTYVFVKYSVNGKHVIRVGDTKLLSDQIPLMLFDGDLCLCGSGGKLASLTLATHINSPDMSAEDNFKMLRDLRKHDECWELCRALNNQKNWVQFAEAALADLEIKLATRIYREIGESAMVYSLEDIQNIEDVNLLSGYCSLFLDKIDEAKNFFAMSSNPKEALTLCMDLLQWEQAMALAHKLAQNQVPFIAREYATQLEFTGNNAEALVHYEKGLQGDEFQFNDNFNSSMGKEHVRLCKSGIARTGIKTGDYRRGIQLAIELNDTQLFYDCGEALKAIGHFQEAAGLLEKASSWDEACSLYIQLKSWQKVQGILPKVTSLKLHKAYAKSKENEGQYKEAVSSYKIAGDLDNVVRIYLDHLSDPHSASEIVLESKSMEGSKMLAKFYEKIGDYDSGLQFLVLCGSISSAFSLAQRQNKLKYYGELLEQSESAQPADFLLLANYFENEKHTLLCGKYHFLAKQYHKALKYLLKASAFSNEENTALSLAIDCVASSNDDRLSNQLIEFLLGETDGSPKDPKYLFRLYMARRHFKEAAKTAVIIANQEQIAGNYRSAHDLLFTMYQELRRNNLSIASDMRNNLILLHRYTLARVHVKLGNHILAAKLLIQVATNISQFPSHVVPILTSTVIECHRANLRKSAFTYAAMLMRSEYRGQIDGKYAKKIEAIVRKAPRGIKDLDDVIEGDDVHTCPVCGTRLASMELTCLHCKTPLPLCIATGQHISKMDLVACPECDFPCFKTEMIQILDATSHCPMCAESVDSNRLMEVDDIAPYLSALG